MYEMALFIILAVSIIANLLLIAALYFLPYRVVNVVLAVLAPNKRHLVHRNDLVAFRGKADTVRSCRVVC
jgi:hypothetical protein